MPTIEKPTSIKDHFLNVNDPRIKKKTRHNLLDILSLTICAVICGADGWNDVEEYGKAKYGWLKSFLELPNGIPSHDTLGRVFSVLSPTELQNSFMDWVHTVSEVTGGQVVPIDGKTVKRSYDNTSDKPAIHMVSAWASENSVLLGQVKTDEKSNEITAIPRLLEILELRGCIVTIDAMGCQKDIAKQIVDNGADYVLTVKDNQKKLRENIESFFEQAQKTGFESIQHDCHETHDKGHGRTETRKYEIVTDVDWLEGKEQWPGLNSIGKVKSECDRGDKKTTETRYFISSLDCDARTFANAVRRHWEIENKVHWVLDVGFREDESRIRKDNAPENLAIIRRLALNLLKQEKTLKVGTNAKRKKAGWDDNYLLKVITS